MICSQEGQLDTSKSPREIARETGISHSSVRRIVKKDLHLKAFRRREVQLLSDADKNKRLDACRRLKARTRWLELSSQMRKSSPFRLRQIPRLIVSTPPFLPSVMFRQNSCSRAGSTSLQLLWCSWQCAYVARCCWCLSNREQRSTAYTTVTMC